MDKIIRNYKNAEITVTWQPHLCIHSTVCFARLPLVFRPSKRPWVDLSNADTAAIIETVDLCPTDALTWKWNDSEKSNLTHTAENQEEVKAKIMKNGPLFLSKEIALFDAEGKELKPGKSKSICRCGRAHKMPFCDGTHASIDFEG